MIRITVLTSLIFLLHTASASAQTPRPDDFFRDGYIGGTLDEKKSYVPKKQPPKKVKNIDKASPYYQQTTPDKKQGTNKKGKQSVLDLFSSPDDSEIKPVSIEALEEHDIPIEKIAVIVNGKENADTFKMLKTYSDLLIRHDLTPEAVYTLQIPPMPPQDAPHDWVKIIIRGGKIAHKRQLIEKYNLERVPTWILRTGEGDVLLEGYENINRFLNNKGELKRKVLASDENIIDVNSNEEDEPSDKT